MAIGGAIGQFAWSHLQREIHSQRFNVNLRDVSEQAGMLSIQGPNSRQLLEEITEGGMELSNELFPFSTHQQVRIAGHNVRAIRLTFVGEMGWELHVPENACVDVYRAVMDAGQKYGIVNAGKKVDFW